MEKTNNFTADIYDYIVDYIKNNKHSLDAEELKFLLNYTLNLKETNLNSIEHINKKMLINDLKKLHENISKGPLTSISYQRLQTEMNLFEALLNEENLDDISYELDKLYLESDMGVRENSTLARKLHSQKKVSR